MPASLFDGALPCRAPCTYVLVLYRKRRNYSLAILFVFKSVGCDYKINSAKKFDSCGVCEGNGKSCKLINAMKKIEASRSK